eukprot:364700-Chlamydomonas_euryale.AAC.14
MLAQTSDGPWVATTSADGHVEKSELGEGWAGAILLCGRVGVKTVALTRAIRDRQLAIEGDQDCLLLGPREPEYC